MQITSKLFFEFVPATDIHKTGMHSMPRVHKIVTDFYCKKMTNRSICPQECAKCQVFLHSITDLDPKTVKYPYALLTWLMKNQVAKEAEKASKQKAFVQPVNFLKEKVEVNGLDALMEQFA